jgi:Ca2+/H+ antiporter
MKRLLLEIRHNPVLWLLGFVPVVFAAQKLRPEAHTLLFVLPVLAIVPLAALLSHATESVAAKTGEAVGGLLNATLGNLTELVPTNSGRSAWFVGVLVLMVYLIFAMTLYRLPPRAQGTAAEGDAPHSQTRAGDV